MAQFALLVSTNVSNALLHLITAQSAIILSQLTYIILPAFTTAPLVSIRIMIQSPWTIPASNVTQLVRPVQVNHLHAHHVIPISTIILILVILPVLSPDTLLILLLGVVCPVNNIVFEWISLWLMKLFWRRLFLLLLSLLRIWIGARFLCKIFRNLALVIPFSRWICSHFNILL